jgi:hypothetical protein
MSFRGWWLLLLLALPAGRAFAAAALLVEEPFGTFGSYNPTGHAAVYLSQVCAETPVKLRRCTPDELGVVISRYHRVGGYDWVAIPVIPYLYAVDNMAQVPGWADLRTEATLRDAYRRQHLEQLVPDRPHGRTPPGDWIQLVGSLYDREIFAFAFDTAAWQDDALIEKFNRSPNRSHFNLFFENCADFSRSILDFYYPGSVHRSFTADLGMTTPKQLAKSLARYGSRREQMGMENFVLPQVSGSIPRSKHIDGVAEAMLRKKYLVPVAFFQPYVAAGIALTYFTGGRFDPSKGALTLHQADLVEFLSTGEPRSDRVSGVAPRVRFPALSNLR